MRFLHRLRTAVLRLPCGKRIYPVSDLRDRSYSLRGIREFPGKTSINID